MLGTAAIKALMIEAGRVGDWLTVSLCEVALGERGAIEAVAAIVADAEASCD